MAQPDSLMAAAADHDPAVGLRAVSALRRLLEQLERNHVLAARAQGWSWQEIAAVLGVSKQAVHQRYAREERTRPMRRR